MFLTDEKSSARSGILSLGFWLIPVLFLPVAIADNQGVVSFSGEKPNADAIVRGFTDDGETLPEGLLPEGNLQGEMNTRGIRLLGEKPSPTVCIQGRAVSFAINFKFGSAEVEPSELSQLEEVAKAMNSQQLQSCRFLVEGHTDAQGPSEFNQHLSELRADTVRELRRRKMAHRPWAMC